LAIKSESGASQSRRYLLQNEIDRHCEFWTGDVT